MIRWFLRGVSRPRVTTRYPRGEEPPPAGFRARALLDPDAVGQDEAAALAASCLPGALTVTDGRGPAARRQPLHRLRAVRGRERRGAR